MDYASLRTSDINILDVVSCRNGSIPFGLNVGYITQDEDTFYLQNFSPIGCGILNCACFSGFCRTLQQTLPSRLHIQSTGDGYR